MTISDPPIFSHTPALSGYRIAISAHRRRYPSGYSQGTHRGYSHTPALSLRFAVIPDLPLLQSDTDDHPLLHTHLLEGTHAVLTREW
jgi:hypothetical protein